LIDDVKIFILRIYFKVADDFYIRGVGDGVFNV